MRGHHKEMLSADYGASSARSNHEPTAVGSAQLMDRDPAVPGSRVMYPAY